MKSEYFIKRVILSVCLLMFIQISAMARDLPDSPKPIKVVDKEDILNDTQVNLEELLEGLPKPNPNPNRVIDLSRFENVDLVDVQRVKWVELKTNCSPCRYQVEAYNRISQALFELERQKKLTQQKILSLEGILRLLKIKDKSNASADQRESDDARGLSKAMELNTLKQAVLPSLNKQIKRLTDILKRKLSEIKECEKTCSKEKSNKNIIKGSPPLEPVRPPIDTSKLPFKWQGPYPKVCDKCALLAQRLNQIPNYYQDEKAALEAALLSVRVEIRLLRLSFDEIGLSDKQKKIRLGEIDKLNTKASALEEKVKGVVGPLAVIIENFKKTLKLYNECIKTCPPKKVSRCEFPDESKESLLIGKNSQVGSSADFKNKAAGKAKGLAMGALGSLLGSKGVSSGGRGKNKGPKKQKDPTRKIDFTEFIAGDTEIGMRAKNFKDGLLISTEIEDTPGNGTFHIQWLEDVRGNRYLPKRYLIFSLYAKWKLTVSWTYSRYVDGQLVERREWDEVSTGSEHLGDFTMYFEGEEGATRSIWNDLGFATAVKGVDGLGALYDLPPAAFEGPCPLRVVTHISLPDGDPVKTQAVISYLKTDAQGKNPEIIQQPEKWDL